MLHDATAVRAAFEHLAGQYTALARDLTVDDLARNGLGQWTVRDLLGHGVRAFSTASANLDASSSIEFTVRSPGEYYRATFSSSPSIHSEIAARGVQSGFELGREPADVAVTVATTVAHATARVAEADDDTIVNLAVGRISLTAYLTTRVVEAGVHLLDLQRALGLPVGVPQSVSDIILLTLADTGDASELILALTGRITLPTGFNVLR